MIATITRLPARIWHESTTAQRVCYTLAALSAASGIFHIGIQLIDGGPWTGPVSWRKPVTFGLSFAIVLATVAWIIGHIRMPATLRRVLLTAFATASLAEVTGITIQAWRGVPSHFNDTDPVSALISHTILAPMGGILIAVVLVLTVAALRPQPDTSAPLRLAIRAGLLVLTLAMVTGAVMIATGAGLTTTAGHTAAYRSGGWLKPSHALTMHAVTVLPLIAYTTDAVTGDIRLTHRVTTIATTAYVLATITVIALNLTAAP
ncbi:hypothetical protein LX16_1685 [Stackebrandtia albiflava]|uniref:DUF998 domain-containing protein n=1 Tax=Stackebrandtia albiflava TaxID=406432 RepID=A0A562VDM6_9ACTN|nr:hypothetical protein [Stackebrandtia albiflava]TWJ15965.1 hypothetical protein LX16_1685 [Stackebrandtia albiflava]